MFPPDLEQELKSQTEATKYDDVTIKALSDFPLDDISVSNLVEFFELQLL